MAGNSLSTVTSHGGRWFMTRVSTNKLEKYENKE